MKPLSVQDYLLYGIGVFGLLTLFFLTSTNPLFWDTTQFGSEHPSYFYSINLRGILLPIDIDSGHVPAFGWYIAVIWMLFGKSLFVSHIALLPFVIGILWQLIIISRLYVQITYSPILFLVLSLEPTLLAQMTLVSPDVCLFFFFTLGLNSINKQNNVLLSLSILGLMITSNRGAMVAFCLFLYHAFSLWSLYGKPISKYLKNVFKHGLLYLPGAVIFITYQLYHYLKTGWIGYHNDMTWASSFEAVEFTGFLKNIGIYGWRMLDFGKFAVWVILIFIIISKRKRLFQKSDTVKLFVLSIIFLLLLPLNMLWAKNLLGHRYLLPCFFLVSLVTVQLLIHLDKSMLFKKGIMLGIICSLLLGNFYIYPNHIAQGWDSSLAYLPYFELKEKMVTHLENENIYLENVQTFFPSQGALGIYKLSNDNRVLKGYTGTSDYIMYSNVNNVNDIILEDLEREYVLTKEFCKGGVFIKLFKKKVSGYKGD